MPDLKKLVQDVLAQRPDVSEQKLLSLVEHKKKTVGGGYLTDQGALFLVSSDLGVSLNYTASQDLSLKDIYIGANSLTIKARILAIYPPKQYERKDGTKGEFRRLLLTDADGTGRLTLWDEKVNEIERTSLKVDDIVRITNVYVRSGLDGSPALNLGQKGTIEKISDDNIPSISLRAKKPSDVNSIQQSIVVEGVVETPPRRSEFTTQDGRNGTLLSFAIGENGRNSIRVAIWNNISDEFVNLNPRSKILLVNVRSKTSSKGGFELHGDEGTTVQVIEQASTQQVLQQNTLIEIEGSLLSIGDKRFTKNGLPSVQALLIGNDYKIYTVILIGDPSQIPLQKPKPKKLHLKGRLVDERRLICDDRSSVTIVDNGEKEQVKEPISTKLSKLEETNVPIFCEVIALSKVTSDEITTKEGETVRKAELIIGDETGETRLVAWREDVKLINSLQPGERLKLKGFHARRAKDGSITLLAKPYSSIERS